MPRRTTYDWHRFWCRPDESIKVLGGFLADPEDSWGHAVNPNAKSFSEISDFACLLLLGEPGLGKSTALEQTFQNDIGLNNSKAIRFDLQDSQSETDLLRKLENNPELRLWKQADYYLTIYFDSLDECLLSIETVSQFLISQLKTWDVNRLKLRIACRTADLPAYLDTELKEIYGRDRCAIYELLPLREKDVRVAATTEGFDPTEFLKAIYYSDIASFAASPITLNMLIALFKRDGRLPKSRSVIYSQGCRLLAEEVNPSRHAARKIGALSPNQRMIIAGRIASALILSSRNAVWIGIEDGNQPTQPVSIRDISGHSEIADGNSFSIDDDNVRETLGTGLFSARGEQSMGFAHQTYGEYLAADYLCKHHVPNPELDDLIFFDDGKLVPQLQEVSIWLAGLDERVFSKILKSQPELLLRVDKESVSNKQREKLAQQLLRNLQKTHLFDYSANIRYFHHLYHDELAQQLRPTIINKKLSIHARLFALDVARECQLAGFNEVYLSLALDRQENIRIRAHAARAIVELGDDSAQKHLMPLALGEAGDDPDDELKGVALNAIWPTHISIDDLLKIITLPKNPDLYGEYVSFLLYKFLNGLTVDQLPAILEWFSSHSSYSESFLPLEDVLSKIILLSWQNLDYPGVIKPFSQLIHKLRLGFEMRPIKFMMYPHNKTFMDETPKRRMLSEQLIQLFRNPGETFSLVFNPPILFGDDLDWTLGKIEADQDVDLRNRWAQTFYYLSNATPPSQEIVAKAYNLCLQFPEIRSIFQWWFEPVLVNSEIAEQQKRTYKTMLSAQNNLGTKVELTDQVSTLLDRFEGGDLYAWQQLVQLIGSTVLAGREPSRAASVDSFFWIEADATTQARLVAGAMRYLEEADTEHIRRSSNSSFAGFQTIDMLSRIDSSFLDALHSPTWKKWSIALLTYPWLNPTKDAIHRNLINRTLTFVEDPGDTLLNVIKQEAKQNFISILQFQLPQLESTELDHSIFEIMKDENLGDVSFDQISSHLLKHNNVPAKAWIMGGLKKYIHANVRDYQKATRYAQILMFYSDDKDWSELIQIVIENDEFGKYLFLSEADWRRVAENLVGKVSEQRVADLYIWLETRFSKSTDPVTRGVHAVSARERVADFRDALLVNLSLKGNPKACGALLHLSRVYPKDETILYYMMDCEIRARIYRWMPKSPDWIIDVALNAYNKKQSKIIRRVRYIVGILQCILFLAAILLPIYAANDNFPIWILWLLLITAIYIQVQLLPGLQNRYATPNRL